MQAAPSPSPGSWRRYKAQNSARSETNAPRALYRAKRAAPCGSGSQSADKAHNRKNRSDKIEIRGDFCFRRWICRALRDRQIQSPLATNFAAGKISSSAALASCGHLRLCKLPWMQVSFLGWSELRDVNPRLRRKFCRRQNFLACGFSTLCQSVDFVNSTEPPPSGSGSICGKPYFAFFSLIAACAAARRAIGTRNGEQET